MTHAPFRSPLLALSLALGFGLLGFTATPLQSQESATMPTLWIGVTGGVTENDHAGNFMIVDDPSNPLFEDGNGRGYLVGLSTRFTPTPVSRWSLQGRISYDWRPACTTVTIPYTSVLLPGDDPNNPRVVEQSLSSSIEIEYDLLNAELLIGLRLFSTGPIEARLAAGPAGQVIVGNHQTQRLTGPREALFADSSSLLPIPTDEQTRTLFDGSIPDASTNRFSLKGGLEIDALLDDRWSIAAGLYYDHGLTDVSEASPWKVHSLVGQIDLRFGL